jgi:hypothetical protein
MVFVRSTEVGPTITSSESWANPDQHEAKPEILNFIGCGLVESIED